MDAPQGRGYNGSGLHRWFADALVSACPSRGSPDRARFHHPLRGLEFHLARDQSRAGRSSADLFRRDSFRHRIRGFAGGVDRTRAPYCLRSARDWLLLAFTGVLMFALNYGLLFWGELHVSSGLAAVLQAMIPVVGMVFAHWLIPAEPLRWQQVGGAALADRRRRAHLRTFVRTWRNARFLGRARDCHRRGRRGFFQCAHETARR